VLGFFSPLFDVGVPGHPGRTEGVDRVFAVNYETYGEAY